MKVCEQRGGKMWMIKLFHHPHGNDVRIGGRKPREKQGKQQLEVHNHHRPYVARWNSMKLLKI